jgi:hypothetical protein
MENVKHTRRPLTITGTDSTGIVRIVYAGRDALECERMKAKALRLGWRLHPVTVHEASAKGLEGLARPAKAGRLVRLPLCAARSANTPDRNLFAYVTRLATQH